MFLDALAAQLCRKGQGQRQSREGAGEEDTGDGVDVDALPLSNGDAVHSSDRGLCVVLHDGLAPSTSGSRALLRHLLFRCLLSSSNDSAVVVLSLIFPALHFQRLIDGASTAPALTELKAAAKAKLAVIDAFSGLSLSPSPPSTAPAPPLPCARHHVVSNSLDLSALTTAVTAALKSSSTSSPSLPSSPSSAHGGGVVFIDGLSSLLFHHPSSAVLSWLLSLRALAGGPSLVVHCDSAVPSQLKTSSQQGLAALNRLASTSLHVRAVVQERVIGATSPSSSSSSRCRLHFTVAVDHRSRSSERLHSKVEHWTLSAEPSSALLSPTVETAEGDRSSSPEDSVSSTLKSLLSSTSSSTSVSLSSTPSTTTAPLPVSTFNLSLSAKQRQAKAQLVLPYQHMGSGRGGVAAVHFGQSGLHFTSTEKVLRDEGGRRWNRRGRRHRR